MKKKVNQRVFKQLAAKKNQKDTQKVVDLGKRPVTRAEFLALQNTNTRRTDTALMGVAAIAEILVKNKLCTYADVKLGEVKMLGVLDFVRNSMGDAYKELGLKASKEDISAYVYEKAVAAKMDKNILTNLFGLAPSKSRIIKPNQHKMIVTK